MVATRFAVATHILLYLALGVPEGPSTSIKLAESVNTNPVVVRRIAGQLARAGLIRIRRGPGGAELARPAEEITLEDVWTAVREPGSAPLLPIHPNPNQACPVGSTIRPILTAVFGDAEAALHGALAGITLATLLVRQSAAA